MTNCASALSVYSSKSAICHCTLPSAKARRRSAEVACPALLFHRLRLIYGEDNFARKSRHQTPVRLAANRRLHRRRKI